ncbi:hypothetical protein M2302_000596 [Micromonospora sp. A200]|uniref:DUF397 domain-containing protein n=1 Tax=Micromonospora sp. A200 TaxID=2940568 RepID=UPI0024760A6E|nr:DUF397 domain-containing protein [Micromonospora sp. A200]MDH6460441.1 hypothetical protein [Micromonospora sp. A200]
METSDRPVWRKSSRSDNNGGACVEVASLGSSILVRDSKNPAGGMLGFTAATWDRFIRQIPTRLTGR